MHVLWLVKQQDSQRSIIRGLQTCIKPSEFNNKASILTRAKPISIINTRHTDLCRANVLVCLRVLSLVQFCSLLYINYMIGKIISEIQLFADDDACYHPIEIEADRKWL